MGQFNEMQITMQEQVKKFMDNTYAWMIHPVKGIETPLTNCGIIYAESGEYEARQLIRSKYNIPNISPIFVASLNSEYLDKYKSANMNNLTDCILYINIIRDIAFAYFKSLNIEVNSCPTKYDVPEIKLKHEIPETFDTSKMNKVYGKVSNLNTDGIYILLILIMMSIRLVILVKRFYIGKMEHVLVLQIKIYGLQCYILFWILGSSHLYMLKT